MGRVSDLFIPEKRDRNGNRFGFVRFISRGDTCRILEDLNRIWIGSYAIRAFVPRFEIKHEARVSQKAGGKVVGREMVQTGKATVRGGSYLEALTGKGRLEWLDEFHNFLHRYNLIEGGREQWRWKGGNSGGILC